MFEAPFFTTPLAATQGCNAGIYIPAPLSRGGAAAGLRQAALYQAAHDITL